MLREGIEIREHNIKAHLDIESDIKKRVNGPMTFTLRINGGNIVDYNLVEYVDVKRKYGQLKQIIIEEYTVSRPIGI